MADSTRERLGRKIRTFFAWWDVTGRRPFSRALVQEFLAGMQAENYKAWDQAHAIGAIKRLAREAAFAGLVDGVTLEGILQISTPPVFHERPANYLTAAQVEKLWNLIDRTKLDGKRDVVAIGFLLYCGLRRAEAVSIEFKHVRVVEGRPALVNLKGKGGKTRTVPMPNWLFRAIQEWVDAAGIDSGRILRPTAGKGTSLRSAPTLKATGLWKIVKRYAEKLGVDELAPHDLRRTYGRMARKAGVDLDQIQETYGHAHLATTQRYIGGILDYEAPPCDSLPPPPFDAG